MGPWGSHSLSLEQVVPRLTKSYKAEQSLESFRAAAQLCHSLVQRWSRDSTETLGPTDEHAV